MENGARTPARSPGLPSGAPQLSRAELEELLQRRQDRGEDIPAAFVPQVLALIRTQAGQTNAATAGQVAGQPAQGGATSTVVVQDGPNGERSDAEGSAVALNDNAVTDRVVTGNNERATELDTQTAEYERRVEWAERVTDSLRDLEAEYDGRKYEVIAGRVEGAIGVHMNEEAIKAILESEEASAEAMQWIEW